MINILIFRLIAIKVINFTISNKYALQVEFIFAEKMNFEMS